MIYDNEYCLKNAQRLVNNYSKDQEELIKQISGELYRFYTLGKHNTVKLVNEALEKGKKIQL